MSGFEGGVEFPRDSGGIIEPPKDFPRSGYACYGCPGTQSRGCCQHEHAGWILRVAEPAPLRPREPSPPEPTKTERRRRWPFGRRTRQ